MAKQMTRKQYLNLLGFTHELIQYQEQEDYFFHGKSRLMDLGNDHTKLCSKANELNRRDNAWGIYYYVREIG